MRFTVIVFSIVALLPLSAIAKVSICTDAEKAEIFASYVKFRSASKAGDLRKVKALSTPAVAQQIADFERTVKDQSMLARQMGGFSPALEEAREVKCEISGKKSRLTIQSETKSQDKSAVVTRVFSVVMFEKAGEGWLVGIKGSTNPFDSQPLESLLKHEQLQLP